MLAVAVSGGPDSLALALLAEPWARARGGRAIGLVVDHGVRAAAALEARLAAAWLAARSIEARIITLVRAGTDAQALRRARLAALAEAAAEVGALHLLLAHHALDQAETVLIRLARGSGEGGLAGMPVVRPLGPVRLLRPLLGAPPVALKAFLRGLGQPWIEDPSNTGRTTRAVLRAALRDGDGQGVGVQAAAQVAAAASRRRAAAEAVLARALAQAVTLSPLGFAQLDAASFAAWDETMRQAALAALLRCIGGHQHPVRQERLAPLLHRMARGGGGTAAGCLVARRGTTWLVAREPAAVAAEVEMAGASPVPWDGRWRVTAVPGSTVGPLGAAEAALLRRTHTPARDVPAAVLATLPAIRHGGVLVAVPPILYHSGRWLPVPQARFRPPVALVELWAGGGELGAIGSLVTRPMLRWPAVRADTDRG